MNATRTRSGRAALAALTSMTILMTGCFPDDAGSKESDPPAAAPPAAGATDTPPATGKEKSALTEAFTLKDRTFTLEVARDDRSRTKGLGDRESIPEDGGMLFIFPKSERRVFWMFDTLIDLDIIFVDPLGFVTAIHTMPAEPPRGANEPVSVYQNRLKRYSSNTPAQFALEFRAGTVAKLGIKPNDKLPGDWARLKKLAR